ncbi:MAG: hypothetical protein K8T26_02595 [Lentisphaerae bacterium]|nr:hypothetical protein [Lentisphaerota bacterium]
MSTDIPLVNASLLELQQLGEELLSRLSGLTGNPWTEASVPKDPDHTWGEEAGATLTRYHEIVRTAHTRRRICDQRLLSRFCQEINSPEGASPEMLRWWLARY